MCLYYSLIIFLSVLLIPAITYSQDLPDTSNTAASYDTNTFNNKSAWRCSGAFTLNYRGIGRRPLEVEVENQLVVSDIFFKLEGPDLEGMPFLSEFYLDNEGKPRLYRISIKYMAINRVAFEFGRFLIPFGSYNDLYRPDLYPLLTKPLIYATPGLDYVSRRNYPHPLFSSGYTDTGLMVHYYPHPHAEPGWFPDTINVFVVNGLSESPNTGREPSPPSAFFAFKPVEGVDIDWGHERNFLADNNDTKTFGGQIHYDFGEAVYGTSLGISAINGKYDIEDQLNYWVTGVDFGARYNGYRLTGEWVIGPTDFRAKNILFVSSTTTPTTEKFLKDRYTTQGGYIQAEFPVPEFPLSHQTNAVISIGQIVRRGPALNVNGELHPNQSDIHTQLNKYTFGLNSVMSRNFNLKLELSYWDFDHFADIDQWIIGGVLHF